MTLEVYSFTTAGSTGNIGPTQDQIDTAYKGTNLEGKVEVTGGIQYWVVPWTGTYTIEAGGGRGGTNPGVNTPMGGFGAIVKGEFNLIAGQVLRIIIGQKGTDGGYAGYAAGGGGASAVSINGADSPMIIAGGGGGASTNNPNSSPGIGFSTNNGDKPGLWGINRDSKNDSHAGGSGASWSRNGADGSGRNGVLSTDRIGKALNGTANGGYPAHTTISASVGGFGGGGSGGYNNGSGGGGGGYSGGNGGRYDNVEPKQQGDGGGSFNTGENQENFSGRNYQNQGYITITIDNNNTLPTNPESFLTQPETNSKNLSNEIIHLSWTPSTDEDGDAIVYTIEFYNGTDWQVILSDLSQAFYDFMLPIINTDNAQIRISAIDSKGAKSDFLISNVFCIQKQFILVQDNNTIKTYQDGNWKSI